jgi:dihydropteroate synthase
LLYLNETIVMGVLNVTPDSFSDGGQWSDSTEAAAQRAFALEREGAGIIDIGGESTRPGAKEVDTGEELERVIPVIERIRRESDIPISIDTRHSHVARQAVFAGADIVNDVSGGMHDADMLGTVAGLGVPMILMHMRGSPETMLSLTQYDDVVQEVGNELQRRTEMAEKAGIHRWLQVVDPGIGFAKGLQENLRLLKNIGRIRTVTNNLPILLGASRKGFIGKLANVDVPSDRDPGTIASCIASLCLDDSAVDCNILRVHNVAACKQAAKVMDAIRNCS